MMLINRLILVSAMMFLSLPAFSAGKHVHGEAELFVAIEGGQVLIELESPADNILGFEHQPRTAAQKKTLEKSLKALADYRSLVNVAEAAACQQVKANIESPFKHHKDEHDHHGHSKKHNHKEHSHKEHNHKEHNHKEHGDDTHSEFHVTYTLKCQNIAAISDINVTAFQSFTGFEEIDLKWVTAKSQGSQSLKPSKTSAKLK